MKCLYNGKYYLGDTVLYNSDKGCRTKGQIWKVDINANTGDCRYYMSDRYSETIISDKDIIRLEEAGAERILNNI